MLSALIWVGLTVSSSLNITPPNGSLEAFRSSCPAPRISSYAAIGGTQQCRHRGTDSVHAHLDGDRYAGECLLILRLHQPTQVELALVVQVELPVGLAWLQFQVQ
jgi:hypothetical protein